jgi:hypothetical protein
MHERKSKIARLAGIRPALKSIIDGINIKLDIESVQVHWIRTWSKGALKDLVYILKTFLPP